MKLPIANLITFARIFLSLAFIFVILRDGFAFKVAALIIFSFASFTDYLDGWAARRFNQKSNLGILMDPIADKALTLSAFFAFVILSIIPLWMAVIVAIRDFTVTGFRFMIPGRPDIQMARKSGKRKTAFQLVAIIGILFFLALRETVFFPARHNDLILIIIYWVMLFVTVTTVWSGVHYVRENWKYLNDRQK